MMQMTPPLSVMYALCEGIEMMREEGLPELWQRHELVSRTVRRGLRTVGLEPVARPGTFSRTVTAVESPWASTAELTSFLGDLRDTHGLVLADGLGALHGRSFRIGHMGPVDQRDVRQTIAALAETFARRGLWHASRVSRAAGHCAAPVAAVALRRAERLAGEHRLERFDLHIEEVDLAQTALQGELLIEGQLESR